MPPRRRKKRSFESIIIIIFLITFWLQLCQAQVRYIYRYAFFALRSCHQVLGGESGEFFSPDYLCSNPPLWCNWTIQVHPGKRIQLQLDDLTPDDSCLWRQDQIHIDEPESQKPMILQKCWREATYTSSSNTVHVVLLIEGSPTATYRGFHGQYQVFGPPQIYNPPDPDYSPNRPSDNANDYYEETVETNSQTQDKSNEDEVNMVCTSLFYFTGTVNICNTSVVVCRLNAGVLFILWLQMGQRTSEHRTHEVVHSDLLKLIGSRLGLKPTQEDSVIMSLSTADVNECHTQLMACDPNADCVNHFGSYSCLCQASFQDRSRSGTGTVCVGTKNTDCSPALSSEAKAVYILFFLLSALVLTLLVLIGLFFHRHRRGHFLVPPFDPNNNISSHHDDVDLPPPPPPRCTPVDLQLLRYNTILPNEPKS
uniref:CUB domain-containing protein n=1 Tax=Periophthalmus magnuspinnatus TaxID=409849 RepID=A0A3B4AS76_9GOBI